MKTSIRTFLLAATLACAVVAQAGEETTSTIKFSDPSKPGTVRINVGRGDLRIRGSDTSEVAVKSEARPVTSKRKDGLREISTASGFSLSEKDNVISLENSAMDWGKRSSDFQLTVPRNTRIIVENSFGGDISCSELVGDVEINSMHGKITLDDVAAGVVVSTMNGEIRANIRELREGKPLSFTSMNGEVQLRLPESVKANVRLRTQNGSVLTDFDESALVTKAEATATPSRSKSTIVWADGKVLSREVQEAIREASAVSATAVREALEAMKQGFEESRINSDEVKRQLADARRQIDQARRESERARAESERIRTEERERRSVARVNRNDDSTPPTPPASPAPAALPKPPAMPKVPTITGGKLVTGTLNGGGPEISVATMNGDVILRKLESK